MELKEVIHFYLGCECELIKDDFLFPHPVTLKPDTLGNALEHPDWFKIRPILRPLSDMTEEEYNAMWEMLGWNERITGNQRAEDIIREFAPIEIDDGQTNNAHWGYFIKIMPYMLSRGFDLFDLINSNQAIDKTKGE